MAEDPETKLNVQIFHELGKLGADQQSIIREIGNSRVDVKERTDTIVKAVDAHVLDDKLRFEKHDGRLSALENWRWYILGIAAAIGFAGWFFGVLK